MENGTFKLKLEFENLLTNNLNYSVISIMDFDQYKDFVINLLRELNQLKEEGLGREEVDDFVKKHYTNVTAFADDTDILFERRFSAITEELIHFCADPFFWDTDFDIYMRKWYKMFETDWYKRT